MKYTEILGGLSLLLVATVVIAKPKSIPQNRPPIHDSIPVVFSQNHDGDTITVVAEGKRLKIRLCGIDAPEISQPLGKESRDYARKLLQSSGGVIYLTAVDQDRYGRTVGEIFIPQNQNGEEIFLNAAMVEAGLAYHYERYSGNCPNKGAIERALTIAATKKIKLYDGTNYVKPWDYRKKH